MTLLNLGIVTLIVHNKLECQLAFACFGFFNVPILFVAFELAVDQVCKKGDIGEATPCGIINLVGNGLGFAGVIAVTPILSS
jgi:hypothetical protein